MADVLSGFWHKWYHATIQEIISKSIGNKMIHNCKFIFYSTKSDVLIYINLTSIFFRVTDLYSCSKKIIEAAIKYFSFKKLFIKHRLMSTFDENLSKDKVLDVILLLFYF